MKALPLLPLFALIGVAGAAAEESVPRTAYVADDLTWSLERNDRGENRSVEIRTADRHTNVTVAVDRLDDARGLEPGAADGPVSFAVRREAGEATCRGTRRGNAVAGTCRFVSSPNFEEGLAQRGVKLGKRKNLVALALVDAHLALVDDLSREGLPITEDDDLIAASALKVTGPWVREIKQAGLRLDKVEDLYAARALNVDAAFLRAMAAAGYPNLTVSQAITMKAVGVTPAYAEAMNRAAGAAHAVEGLGELQ